LAPIPLRRPTALVTGGGILGRRSDHLCFLIPQKKNAIKPEQAGYRALCTRDEVGNVMGLRGVEHVRRCLQEPQRIE
jgi:hypothetical protein